MARRTPALNFEEIGFDQDNEPVVKATSFFRDDLLRFRLIRRKSRGLTKEQTCRHTCTAGT